MITRARKNRAQAKTFGNERSNRSHSVFKLRIDGFNTATTEACSSTLNLVSGILIKVVRINFNCRLTWLVVRELRKVAVRVLD